MFCNAQPSALQLNYVVYLDRPLSPTSHPADQPPERCISVSSKCWLAGWAGTQVLGTWHSEPRD